MRRAAMGGAAALLLIAGTAVLTASNTVTNVNGAVTLVADQDFRIEVAGAEGPTLGPTPSWETGRPLAVVVPLLEPRVGFDPGDSYRFALATRNASPQLSGVFSVSVVDERPGQASLFDVLEYTLSVDGTPIVGPVRGADIASLTHVVLGELSPGEFAEVDLEMHFPEEAGNEFQGLGAWIQVRFDGENL